MSEEVESEHNPSGISSVVPTNLEVFLPYVCTQLNMPFAVIVHKRQLAEYVPKTLAARRMSRRIPLQTSHAEPTSRANVSEESGAQMEGTTVYGDHHTFVVHAVMDPSGRVVEVVLEKCAPPCLLAKVFQLTLPHQPALERLTVRRCGLTGQTLAELARLPLRCSLTDVCLDDSPGPAGNYEQLLDNDRVRRLSLARCSLDDAAVERLATRLELGGAAARSLRSLDLSANRIGDAGARALANALRTNRTLLHLNLAGNEVGDDGGLALFDVLHEFPLTEEEVPGKRRRRMSYVKSVVEAQARCLVRLEAAARSVGEDVRKKRTATTRAAPSERSLEERAAMLARELLGEDDDPYSPAETVERHGRAHCRGNWVLVYLNVAYNSLSARGVAALRRALAAQVSQRRPGLLRVVLDGNPMPAAPTYYDACGALLEQAFNTRNAKTSLIKRTKSKS